MQPYLRSREQQDKRARLTGLAATVLLHAVALVICLTSGLKYLDPPPPETSFLIDFEEDVLEPEKPVQTKVGRQPQAEETDPTAPVELVQKAESPHVSDRPNRTPATGGIAPRERPSEPDAGHPAERPRRRGSSRRPPKGRT